MFDSHVEDGIPRNDSDAARVKPPKRSNTLFYKTFLICVSLIILGVIVGTSFGATTPSPTTHTSNPAAAILNEDKVSVVSITGHTSELPVRVVPPTSISKFFKAHLAYFGVAAAMGALILIAVVASVVLTLPTWNEEASVIEPPHHADNNSSSGGRPDQSEHNNVIDNPKSWQEAYLPLIITLSAGVGIGLIIAMVCAFRMKCFNVSPSLFDKLTPSGPPNHSSNQTSLKLNTCGKGSGSQVRPQQGPDRQTQDESETVKTIRSQVSTLFSKIPNNGRTKDLWKILIDINRHTIKLVENGPTLINCYQKVMEVVDERGYSNLEFFLILDNANEITCNDPSESSLMAFSSVDDYIKDKSEEELSQLSFNLRRLINRISNSVDAVPQEQQHNSPY